MGQASSQQSYDCHPTLAAKLASQKPCLLAFLSPSCGLCAALRPTLSKVEQEGWLAVARLDATMDSLWAPELLRYDVEAVPCFVVLRPDGRALCKTAQPTTAQQMASDLERMLQAVRRP